jgi:hypothetical protein
MEEIEEKEQLLIQHIRTAGLRQNKELTIIEEILTIRKERRKFVTQTNEKLQFLEKENVLLQNELSKIHDKHENLITKLLDNHQLEMKRFEKDFQLLEEKYIQDKQSSEQNQHQHDEELLNKYKKHYEMKLMKIEKKLQTLVIEKETNDLEHAQKIAEDMVKKVKQEVEEKYEQRIQQ